MGVEVLVVQHGEKVRASGDPGLTETGHRQAGAVASWLASTRPDVGSIWASPLRRAQETAAPAAAALGLVVQTDDRFRERMNWDDEMRIGLDEFLAEWQRATDDRSFEPTLGDSSRDAAARFIDGLIDLERHVSGGAAVVVAHGGVTVDTLRTIVGDDEVLGASPDLIADGVPCGAITRLQVAGGVVTVLDFPTTDHLDQTSEHRPA